MCSRYNFIFQKLHFRNIKSLELTNLQIEIVSLYRHFECFDEVKIYREAIERQRF